MTKHTKHSRYLMDNAKRLLEKTYPRLANMEAKGYYVDDYIQEFVDSLDEEDYIEMVLDQDGVPDDTLSMCIEGKFEAFLIQFIKGDPK